MINSRALSDLHPIVEAKARAMIDKCKQEKIDIIVTSTYRDNQAQNALYAQGRTTAGNIVTNARAGESVHNYKLAFDIVPMRAGKPVWGTSGTDGEIWQKVGKIGKSCGLEWAGDWKTFKEYPHFQWTNGLTIHELMAGKRP